MSEGKQPCNAGHYTWKRDDCAKEMVYIDCPFNFVYIDDVFVGHVDDLDGEFIYIEDGVD